MAGQVNPPAGGLELGPALQQAIAALRDERLDEADRLFDALLQRWPDDADVLHFAGLLRHAHGDSPAAVALIERACGLLPTAPGPWNNLGNIHLQCGRLDEAEAAYRACLDQDADHAQALANLGVALKRRGELMPAELSLRRAIERDASQPEAWYNLSEVLIQTGRIAEGLRAHAHAVTLWPRHTQARESVLRALIVLGETEQAAQLYREWLAEEPDNPVVQHNLAACLAGAEAPERASDDYVEQVFDSFATSFDAKLAKLDYRAPQLLAEALARVLPSPARQFDVVDLGCGTGLCGPLLRPWAATLAGCDLSVGMLRQARQRACYDRLHKAELVYYLDTQPGCFDLAVSADTLCYFGRLDEALAAAQRALRPGGWVGFTVEALPPGDARPHLLRPNGRYAHARPYLESSLTGAGLDRIELRNVQLRMEAGQPVEGWLVLARRTA